MKKKKNHPKCLELKTNVNKVAGYKVNIHKSMIFLYTRNRPLEPEIKNRMPFSLAPKKRKNDLAWN